MYLFKIFSEKFVRKHFDLSAKKKDRKHFDQIGRFGISWKIIILIASKIFIHASESQNGI